MKTFIFLLAFMLLTASLVAQDAPIPQDIPLQRPNKRLDNDSLLNSLRAINRQSPASKTVTASPQDRIAALEAKVAALEAEVDGQKATIKQLQERLDRQEQKK